MDTKKDMRETDTNHRDTMSDTNTHSPVAYKNRNEFSLLCLKRTERLSAALYMVTGLIPDAEPLKWRLREKTLVLLTDMAIIRETLTADRMSVMNRARDTIAELTTLLNVAYAGDPVIRDERRGTQKRIYDTQRYSRRRETDGIKHRTSSERFI